MGTRSSILPAEFQGIPVAYLKFVALALFGAAVIAKFIYLVVKTVRITVLKIDPPMAGFDSEPATEAPVQEVCGIDEMVQAEELVVQLPVVSGQ